MRFNQKEVRDEIIHRTDVLDEIKTVPLLPDDIHVSVEGAAEYYEVPEETIKSTLKYYKKEFKDEVKVLKGQELKEFKNHVLKRTNFEELYKFTPALTLIPYRALLRIGLLLKDSEIATQIRKYLLNNNSINLFLEYYRQEVRTKFYENENWFALKDIGKLIGIKNPRNFNLYYHLQSKRFAIETNGGSQKITFTNEKGLIVILSNSRQPKAIEIAKKINLNVLTTTKEQSTLKILIDSFKDLNMETQFPVSDYFIDLYFPDYKIAVECDEFGHSHYSQKKEKERERVVKEKLGCKFIRFNPDDENFNIGDVIYQIRKEIERMKAGA